MNKKTSVADFVTKSDLNKAIKGSEKVLRTEILRVEEKVEKLQDGQERIEVTLNRVANQLDGFVGRVDDLTVDNKVGANQISELRATAKDHEKRITKLESPN